MWQVMLNALSLCQSLLVGRSIGRPVCLSVCLSDLSINHFPGGSG